MCESNIFGTGVDLLSHVQMQCLLMAIFTGRCLNDIVPVIDIGMMPFEGDPNKLPNLIMRPVKEFYDEICCRKLRQWICNTFYGCH